MCLVWYVCVWCGVCGMCVCVCVCVCVFVVWCVWSVCGMVWCGVVWCGVVCVCCICGVCGGRGGGGGIVQGLPPHQWPMQVQTTLSKRDKGDNFALCDPAYRRLANSP